MAERRETGRTQSRKNRTSATPQNTDTSEPEGERIAKYLARCGVASRRACETMIAEGKVFVDGERLISPAVKVTGREDIRVGRKRIFPPERTRLWRYHKPAGLITTNHDPAGRRTIFDELPKSLPRTITIGRLDLNTEGLLLLTNDGELARALELPDNAFERTYRARAHGEIDETALESLKAGLVVDGDVFGAIHVTLERRMGTNSWFTVSLTEGRKREVRRALEAVGLKVNRLIRTEYGPFELADLKPGAVEEVSEAVLSRNLAHILPKTDAPAAAGSRFRDSPKKSKLPKQNRSPRRPKRRSRADTQ